MRGFTARSTVEQAVAWIDGALPAFSDLPSERVPLQEVMGRVLSADVYSAVNVPGFPRSMMDGYALRADETQGASAYNRLEFRIVGSAWPSVPYLGRIGSGEAVRIMTGAPLPTDADAVMPVEQTVSLDNEVWLLDQISPGKHVGQIGEDIRAGELVLPRGRTLRPQDVGVLSSIGLNEVSVIRPPHVRVLITGNELLPAGTPPQDFRIADANGPMLTALIRRDGGHVDSAGLIPDDPARLRDALAVPSDVILISGGSSVGQEDHAPQLLAELGNLAIHGIAMRPSSPTGLGRIGNTLVFLLPGNPVSCLCAYDFFAGRSIRALAGRSRDWPYPLVRARLTRKLVSTVGRMDYARVLVQGEEAEPLTISGAGVLSSTTRSNGFVIIPSDSEGYAAGTVVDVRLYEVLC